MGLALGLVTRACRRVGRLVLLAGKRGVCVYILFCVPKQWAFEVFEVNIAFAWLIYCLGCFSGVQVMSGWGAKSCGREASMLALGVSFGSYVGIDEPYFFRTGLLVKELCL